MTGLRLGTQALQQRQAERGGLAGAGLRAGQQVVAGQGQRNGLGLDRGGGGVTLFCERTQQEGRKPEGFKRHSMKLQYSDRNGRSRPRKVRTATDQKRSRYYPKRSR